MTIRLIVKNFVTERTKSQPFLSMSAATTAMHAHLRRAVEQQPAYSLDYVSATCALLLQGGRVVEVVVIEQ